MNDNKRKKQFYLELINCMLRQKIIPQEVLDNWNSPKYCMGYLDNYDFEMRAFLNHIDKLDVRDALVSEREK